MPVEIKVPSPGESITQVQLVKWLISDGDAVEKDQEIAEIDSDKASFPISSPEDGTVNILVKEGETIAVGTLIATVEPGAVKAKPVKTEMAEPPVVAPPQAATRPAPVTPLAERIMQENKVTRQEISDFSGEKKNHEERD